MSTFTAIKANIRANLNDAGVTYFSATDLDDSVQDAYDEILLQTGCLIKKAAAQSFTANLSYYDLRASISDFIGCLAMFDISANRWLDDNLSLKDLDKDDDRWETRLGTPSNWVSVNFKYIALYPKYAVSGKTFDLYYRASAPTVVNGATPLIADDMQSLIEDYSTADLLEQAEEFSKANEYWMDSDGFYPSLEMYKERVRLLAKADMLFKA